MESSGSFRHLAFFEELARLDESDQNWRAVSAGLVVMRLVDEWILVGIEAVKSDCWGVSAVRDAIDEIPDSTPLRRGLLGIVDCVASAPAVDVHALIPRLMAYGQLLEYDARWTLAADVYETVVAHADPVSDSDLVVPAFIQLAFCWRSVDDLDRAAVAYENASRVAHAAGDMIGVLRSRIGDAKLAIARGNMPQAEAILQETTDRAQARGLDDIRSRALHERAYLAGLSGQHARAVHFAYQALAVTPSPRDRDRLLSNIATGLHYLGLWEPARDAYLILAMTAQEQYIRWMAELNLMELSAKQGVELQFDRYRRELESADFNPLLRVTYLLHVGRGYHALGHSEAGVPYLERAIEIASQYQLNQLVFECESALGDTRRPSAQSEASEPFVPDDSVQTVVDAVQQMKEMAGIG